MEMQPSSFVQACAPTAASRYDRKGVVSAIPVSISSSVHRAGGTLDTSGLCENESMSYSGDCGEVRTDHELRLWGATFLRLHYRLAERAAPARA